MFVDTPVGSVGSEGIVTVTGPSWSLPGPSVVTKDHKYLVVPAEKPESLEVKALVKSPVDAPDTVNLVLPVPLYVVLFVPK